jgi:hypothetical protein
MGVVLVYVKNWDVHNILLDVAHTDKSLNAKKLSNLLIAMMQRRTVMFQKIRGVMKDSVYLNPAALRENPGLWENSSLMDCMSHVINRIGERLEAPVAQAMCSAIVATAAHSGNFKAEWRRLTGSAFPRPGETRWYNWVDVYRAILNNLESLGGMFSSPEFHGTAAAKQWFQIYDSRETDAASG